MLDVLDELKKSGVIRYTGLGGTSAYQMARLVRTGKFDVVLTAFNYSLLWREAAHEILPAAKAANVGVVIGSPLQQGSLTRCWPDEVLDSVPWLSKPRRDQLKALYAFCREIKMSLPELSIRWVISNPDISTVLMGAANPQQVQENFDSVLRAPAAGHPQAGRRDRRDGPLPPIR